jgi:hypothetical protein
MSNTAGNAYALTALCPLKKTTFSGEGSIYHTRSVLQKLPATVNDCEDGRLSPMAAVANTYLARFFILDDVFFQQHPHTYEHLQSAYLVFASDFHGDLETYLVGMYNAIQEDIEDIWAYCVGFEKVTDGNSFVEYIKKCQVKTSFAFNGSTDDSLEEQLKSLYLKQEFSKFVFNNQGKSPEEILAAYRAFDSESKPSQLSSPTWKAGFSTLKGIVKTVDNLSQK